MSAAGPISAEPARWIQSLKGAEAGEHVHMLKPFAPRGCRSSLLRPPLEEISGARQSIDGLPGSGATPDGTAGVFTKTGEQKPRRGGEGTFVFFFHDRPKLPSVVASPIATITAGVGARRRVIFEVAGTPQTRLAARAKNSTTH